MNKIKYKLIYFDLGGLTWKELCSRIWFEFNKDRILDQSAKLSYYFLLSIFPLLLFLTALLGLILQIGPIFQDTLYQSLSAVLPNSVSGLLRTTLSEITKGTGTGKLSFALAFTLWTASSGMLAIMDGLNTAYEVVENRPWWKKSCVAVVLTTITASLIGLAMLFLIFGDLLYGYIADYFELAPIYSGIWHVLGFFLLFITALITFNVIYVYAPNLKRRQWHWIMPGTVIGVTMWLLVSFAFKLYLSFFDRYTVTYGSLGTVIILMLWLYLSGIAILVGAEANSEIEKSSNLRR